MLTPAQIESIILLVTETTMITMRTGKEDNYAAE
jgi:hypothetical protein